MKVSLSISVEDGDLELLRSFSAKSGVPVSRLYEDYTSGICRTIRAAGLDKKAKYSKLDMMRMVIKGSMETM